MGEGGASEGRTGIKDNAAFVSAVKSSAMRYPALNGHAHPLRGIRMYVQLEYSAAQVVRMHEQVE